MNINSFVRTTSTKELYNSFVNEDNIEYAGVKVTNVTKKGKIKIDSAANKDMQFTAWLPAIKIYRK